MDNEQQRCMALVQELVIRSAAHPSTCRKYLVNHNWNIEKALKDMRDKLTTEMRKYSPFI